GGEPVYTSIFLPPNDRTNTLPSLAPLGNYGGHTHTFALGISNIAPSSATNLAVGTTISNQPGAMFFGTLATDQRGYFRDSNPDVGAYEMAASKRLIIEEILFANTNNQFIEFYVPRDSSSVNVSNFSVYIHGQRLHTFTNQNLGPGETVVLFARNATSTAVPTGVYSQIASNNILMDPN